MNRYILITTGILILLSVIALWIYLIAYGAPEKPREVFSNLGIFKGSEATVRVLEENNAEEGSSQLALGGAQLEQLTTRAVAGFIFTGDEVVRYAERGTGYIFEIDLKAGTEKQLSLITIPQTTEATFSPEGTAVALTTDENGIRKVKILDLLEEDAEEGLPVLQQGAYDLSWKSEGVLYFAVEANGMTLGYTYDVAKGSAAQVLTVPFTGAEMLWGNNTDSIYAFSKPAAAIEGYLYLVEGGVLKPIQNGGMGLISLLLNGNVIYSIINDGKYATKMASGAEVYSQGIFMLPEKCVSDPLQEKGAWCAAPLGAPSATYVEEWYKGERISDDQLWLTDLTSGKASLKSDLSTIARRAIDVSGIKVNESGNKILLRNKIDGALWIYRITTPIVQ